MKENYQENKKDYMKCLVFDSGPIISLTTNNLLWILEPLKNKFKGRFVITEGVRKELIDKPLTTKKFKFEALHCLLYTSPSPRDQA